MKALKNRKARISLKQKRINRERKDALAGIFMAMPFLLIYGLFLMGVNL